MNKSKRKIVKVCHVTSAHSRYDLRIFRKECCSLAKSGFEVTYLVNDTKPNEIIDNVNIVSTNFLPKSRLDRWFASKSFLRKKMIDIDADLYHFHDPDLLPLAKWIEKLGKISIFDSHEDVPQQILDKTYIPKTFRLFVSYIYSKYELFVIKNISGVVVATPHMVKRFKRSNYNVSVVTNYPIVKDKQVRTHKNTLRKICFAGSIDHRWNHDKIINAINEIDNIEYLLAGNSRTKYFENLEKLPGWAKVRFLGRIPFEQVTEMYNESIVGLAFLGDNGLTNEKGTLGVTKIFEYMEAGLPFICTSCDDWKEIIDRYHCGIAIETTNTYEVKNAIERIVNDTILANQMGKNGREAIEKIYNWESQASILLQVYKSI